MSIFYSSILKEKSLKFQNSGKKFEKGIDKYTYNFFGYKYIISQI